MVLDNISIARDNTIRVSQLKLANITRLILNKHGEKHLSCFKKAFNKYKKEIVK